jgi:translation initiation factor IF-2
LNVPGQGQGDAGKRNRVPPRPNIAGRLATPPTPKPRAQEPEKKAAAPTGPKKIADIPPEFMARGEGGHAPNIIDKILDDQKRVKPHGQPVPPLEVTEEEDEEGRGKGKKRGPGGVVGRDARHKERNERQQKRKATGSEVEPKSGRLTTTVLLDLDEAPRHRKARFDKKRLKKGPTEPRKGKVPISLPITVRSLSEAIGMRSAELLLKLMGHGMAQSININTTLEPLVAETIALEHGCELDVKRQLDMEELLITKAKEPDNPENLLPRAPVVTIMGHVDHGKTSLLDKIRQSNVAATEAGGITQVIRAWRVEHGGRPITFLDTPGHEAFTKMRARGANVTDIAVIVVAADDGVMPQTEEAISHAKAAGVSIVVAINKVDLPSANIRKTEQQLYGLGLIPDNMGGEVPFVQTSAATGKGIDDLLDTLSVVAELKELKANPNKVASGTCLEAYLSEGEGVLATILVQNGTLHRGDVVLTGASYGRIRAMYDDLGRPLESAGPSVPVRITGLDEVPNADDPFMVVPDLAVAREIADRRKAKQQEAALHRRGPITLDTLSEAKVTELKVILKAEARGSIEAIRKELEKLQHAEVRVRILWAAIGGITESDVQLALASPHDTLILGFNAVPDDRARALAEERGIQIRQYNIIYQLTDDIRAALEGKLKPREEVVHLGRAMVRETFKISRVGTIAGCYVTQGVIERSAKVRVIRSGVVVYPPADRTASLESLKRFKDDVREVREGFECGMKIAGYDDIKVDDVIEAYRIEQVQRTLSGEA